MELRDKVVVVTGGASGIGTGLCRRFREEGVRGLVIADLNGDVAADLAAEVGGKSYALDVRDEAALAAMVAETEVRVWPDRSVLFQRGHPESRRRKFLGHFQSQ